MADYPRKHVREIFAEALDVDPARREQFVHDACAGDGNGIAEVTALLRAYEQAGLFLSSPTSDPSRVTYAAEERTMVASSREGPGTIVGVYKILQLIGEGGFGSVFMAEQEKPLRRRVALKIIKLGMDTKQVIGRFEAERQALAIMDHPNIAKVLDAGSTDQGRPYFVMELVRGEPITAYCDRHSLPMRERLELFAQVCNAVQHAHQKGIIHRDIKPSNVLVTIADGKPIPKVIDFGIAKATSARLTEKTVFTEFRQLIGTPEYMSPEQAEMSGVDIDTRSDVYSLGVLLYELLTGSTPFDSEELRSAAFAELQRIIREVEPPKPSTRLSTMKDTLAGVAARRHTEPASLTRQVRGELDWIVMKALEKDRTRRYDTASSLAADIQHYLHDEPVLAGPPGPVYRFRKFARRNTASVTAAALIALALVLGLAGTLWQAYRVGVQRDNAVAARLAESRERDKAREAAQAEAAQRVIAEKNEKKAEAINKFLLDMLGSANVREIGRNAKVSEALDNAASRVGSSFNDQPALEAEVRQILGRTYLSVGLLDQAQPQIDAAIALNRETHGEESREFALCLAQLALLKQRRGDFTSSIETYQRAIDIVTKTDGPESRVTLGMRSDAASVLLKLQRYEDAAAECREIVDIHVRRHGREDDDAQRMINGLAVSVHQLKQMDEAEALYREAADISMRLHGETHPDTLIAQLNLALLLNERRKFHEAEPLALRTFEGMKSAFGDSHMKTAEAAASLGRLYVEQGRFKDAVAYYEQALAISRQAQGDSTEEVALNKSRLAEVLLRTGDIDRATLLQREAVAVDMTIKGADARKTLVDRTTLADILSISGRSDEAEAIYLDVIATCSRVLGDDDPATTTATINLGVALMRQNRFAEAEPHVRKATETGLRVDGPDHTNSIINRHNLASLLRELGRYDEAERIGREALDASTRVLGAQHANTASVRSGYAATLAKLGRIDEAKREYEQAIAVAKAALGTKHTSPAGYSLNLGTLMLDNGEPHAAEPLLREAVQVLSQARGPKDRRTANAQLELARCLSLQNRFADAEPILIESESILVASNPAGHKDIRKAWQYLVDLYAAWNAAEPGVGSDAKVSEWRSKLDAIETSADQASTQPASQPATSPTGTKPEAGVP